MSNPPVSRSAAMLSLASATVIWGGMFPISKYLLGEMDALTMTMLRYGLVAPLFLLLLARREGWSSLRPQTSMLPIVVLGGLGFAGFNLLMFFGVSQSRPEHGAIVMALQPLIAALILWARSGQRPAPHSFAALGLAIVGVVLLVTNGHVSRLAASAALAPTLMMIAGGTCWVLYSMGAERYPDWSPLRYTALTASGGALVIAVLWVLARSVGAVRMPHDTQQWLALGPALAYLTLLAALLAVLNWNRGIRGVGARNGMLFINLVPLTALGRCCARSAIWPLRADWRAVGARQSCPEPGRSQRDSPARAATVQPGRIGVAVRLFARRAVTGRRLYGNLRRMCRHRVNVAGTQALCSGPRHQVARWR